MTGSFVIEFYCQRKAELVTYSVINLRAFCSAMC
jgi:hypothetical protein